MCGIVGIVSKTEKDLKPMLDCISHRGPDGNGSYHDYSELNNFHIQFGHKRLEIIDLTENAKQPFVIENKFCVITYNGEIYNYKDLKNKYLKDIDFYSNSDTEVIIQLYIKYGQKSFSWLKGMFAFAIYDKQKQVVFLVRDSLGIKPLYYYFDENNLYFSSEIKSLKKQNDIDLAICNDSIFEFFMNGFVYEPNTGYKNIHKIFPGSFIEFSLKEKINKKKFTYWSPSNKKDISKKNNSINGLIDLVKKEFNEHLISDVPVGLFFSGGIDSSVLLSMSDKKISSYFINSPTNEQTNKDFYYAKIIANKLKRELKLLHFNKSNASAEDLLKTIKHVASSSEELIADYTFSVSQEISIKAKSSGFKVMLSGMGGDEMFLGYPRYKLLYYENYISFLKNFINPFLIKFKFFQKKIDRFNSFFEKKNFVLRYSNLIGYFHENELKLMLKKFESLQLKKYTSKLNNLIDGYSNYSKIKQAQILDLYGFLSHNFMVADKSSMLAGVEIRVPLATPEIFDYNMNLKEKNFINFFKQKLPLLQILKKKLPLKYFNRPKQGFNPNLDIIISQIGSKKILDILNDNSVSNFISFDYVKKTVLEHFQGKKNNSYKLYQLLFFKYWIDHNVLSSK